MLGDPPSKPRPLPTEAHTWTDQEKRSLFPGCKECGLQFAAWWHHTCPPKTVTITREQFRKAMEYGIDNAAMKGNMIDVAVEFLFKGVRE